MDLCLMRSEHPRRVCGYVIQQASTGLKKVVHRSDRRPKAEVSSKGTVLMPP